MLGQVQGFFILGTEIGDFVQSVRVLAELPDISLKQATITPLQLISSDTKRSLQLIRHRYIPYEPTVQLMCPMVQCSP